MKLNVVAIRTMDDFNCIKSKFPPSIPLSTIRFACSSLVFVSKNVGSTIPPKCVVAFASVMAIIGAAPSTSLEPSTIPKRILIL
jgi:hypothetical protein